jgi:hypothetical protein
MAQKEIWSNDLFWCVPALVLNVMRLFGARAFCGRGILRSLGMARAASDTPGKCDCALEGPPWVPRVAAFHVWDTLKLATLSLLDDVILGRMRRMIALFGGVNPFVSCLVSGFRRKRPRDAHGFLP